MARQEAGWKSDLTSKADSTGLEFRQEFHGDLRRAQSELRSRAAVSVQFGAFSLRDLIRVKSRWAVACLYRFKEKQALQGDRHQGDAFLPGPSHPAGTDVLVRRVQASAFRSVRAFPEKPTLFLPRFSAGRCSGCAALVG
ncbi:MAG: hypothetical protein VYA97_01955 [Pseudomonadota bacterium]|nr:hypothetical protein [Phaeobacter gallaeciensis]MEC9310496.1 hypothetical protein [Pseudomonadota bacterium]